MIHTGDCVTVMRTMPADSVDAVVTDPPYGLEFMGKAWDGPALWGKVDGEWKDRPKGGTHPFASDRPRFKAGPAFQAWCEQWGREALRVTKPGGYLLAFGGTRTHHRLVCGLEDAGWIIRDELDWIYASGFPKGKANLKPAHEPIVLARKPGPLRPLGIDAGRISMPAGETLAAPSASGAVVGGHQGQAGYDRPWKHDPEAVQRRVDRAGAAIEAANTMGRWPSNLLLSDPALFDEPNPEVVGSGATQQSPADYNRSVDADGGVTRWNSEAEGSLVPGYGDSGGYSRFFIVPKAGRADREPVVRGQVEKRATEGFVDGDLKAWPDGTLRPRVGTARQIRANSHPTVKPVDLMRHLIRLVTPSGGTVLDPFAGSGSTLIAAELEGFAWIAIEKEPEYVAIAEARLNGTQRGLGLDVPAPTPRRDKRDRLADIQAGESHPMNGTAPRSYSSNLYGGWKDPDEEPAA